MMARISIGLIPLAVSIPFFHLACVSCVLESRSHAGITTLLWYWIATERVNRNLIGHSG